MSIWFGDSVPLRVLIIDDDAMTRDIIRFLVSSFGHEYAEASNGRRGIKKLESESFDGVILDVFMPDQDGFEVLRWISKNRRELPAVVFTARNEMFNASFAGLAEKLGALKAFAKPVEPEDIEAALEILASNGARGTQPA